MSVFFFFGNRGDKENLHRVELGDVAKMYDDIYIVKGSFTLVTHAAMMILMWLKYIQNKTRTRKNRNGR